MPNTCNHTRYYDHIYCTQCIMCNRDQHSLLINGSFNLSHDIVDLEYYYYEDILLFYLSVSCHTFRLQISPFM